MFNLLDENTNKEGIVAKAKVFRSVYNLNLSRIACKLLIKQNETWYTTDIKCETDIMRESRWWKKVFQIILSSFIFRRKATEETI